MASPEERAQLRRMTGEHDSETYDNVQLDNFISDASGDLNVAASRIWAEKASDYADLVDITEAGSSRKNSDLFKNAREQSEHYAAVAADSQPQVEGSFSTTRKIVRQ